MEPEISYIQATPGFNIAYHDHDKEDPELKLKAYFNPIIAWRIKSNGQVIPIYVNGSDEWNPIVYPDGRVGRLKQYSDINFFTSVEIWLEYETKRESVQEETRKMKEMRGLLGFPNNFPGTQP